MNRFYCRDEEVEVAPEVVYIDRAGEFACEICDGTVDVLFDDAPIEQEWEADVSRGLAFLLGNWRGRQDHGVKIADLMFSELDHVLDLLVPVIYPPEEADDEVEN